MTGMRPATLAVLAVLAAACAATSPARQPDERPTVVASIYPLYEFAIRIGGEHADVRLLVPPGAEPHDYEPTARDVATLTTARILFYNGAGIEPWVDRLLPTLPPTVARVKTTAGLDLIQYQAGGPRGERMPRTDGHVWLDPLAARQQAGRIVAGFIEAYPERKALYEANGASLVADLQGLHAEYTKRLHSCRTRTFITTHAAFGYLARRYALSMVPISGLSPEAEPSPARVREVVRLARAHGIRVIYGETLTSTRSAETVAREVGGRVLALDPIEGRPASAKRRDATYLTTMHQNLRSLTDGLGCS